MKIFLFGSRSVTQLHSVVCAELDRMIAEGAEFLVGDCNGADTLFQRFLHGKGYANVTVYHMGKKPRNNEGDFKTVAVQAPQGVTGREYYAAKDKVMADLCDKAYCVWNGQSKGSRDNMEYLREINKPYSGSRSV